MRGIKTDDHGLGRLASSNRVLFRRPLVLLSCLSFLATLDMALSLGVIDKGIGKANDKLGETTDWVKTNLREMAPKQLQLAIQTRLANNRDEVETIFEFKNDAYTCGPSTDGGSVFEPSSYNCSTTCQLLDDAINTGIGTFHHTLVTKMLPTLQAMRALKIAITGRQAAGDDPDFVDDPIGGVAFIFNFLHEAENPICKMDEYMVFHVLGGLFQGLERLMGVLKRVPVAQVKTIARVLDAPTKKLSGFFDKWKDEIGPLCEKTLEIHNVLLLRAQVTSKQLSILDQYTAIMIPPMVEGACVSANTIFTAERLAADIEEPEAGTTRGNLHMENGTCPAITPSPEVPRNLTLYDRRYSAAALTPHARDLPIRRMLMYSDWGERRSSSQVIAKREIPANDLADVVGTSRGLKEDTVAIVDGILGGSLDAMNGFLQLFAALDETYRTFGTVWLKVATAAEDLRDALVDLFDKLVPALPVFDLLFEIGDIFQFITCPKALGFLCIIDEIISAAVDAVISAFEKLLGFDLLEFIVDKILSLLSLPDISFNFPDLLPEPYPWEVLLDQIEEKLETLVEDVLSNFLNDPLPLLFAPDASDTTGLDVLYAGARRDTTVALNDCADAYGGEQRLPLMFHAVQRSAWCPRGHDFTAASLYPCGGVGGVEPITGDACEISSEAKVPLVCINENYPPEFYDEDGTLNFPYWLPSKSDYILQAHYACARESTVHDLGLLPAEVKATQGAGKLSCSTKRFAVDFAEVGRPCMDQEFIDDTEGNRNYRNLNACSSIDANLADSDSNEYLSELQYYLKLWNAQVAAHKACDGDHMCLVDVWISEVNIEGMLDGLLPSQLSRRADDMASQHVSLYLWGTSNPIYSRLRSTHKQWYPAANSKINDLPSTSTDIAAGYTGGTDIKEYTSIQCGEGSYLEQFHWQLFRERRYKGRGYEEGAKVWYSCYGDRAGTGGILRLSPRVTQVPRNWDGYTSRSDFPKATMDCSGERGGFKEININLRRSNSDNDKYDWSWKCMNSGTRYRSGESFPASKTNRVTCRDTPIQSLDHVWTRKKKSRKFWGNTEYDFIDNFFIKAYCPSESPLEISRDLTVTNFSDLVDTNVGKYVLRKEAWVTKYEPDVPECQIGALAKAEECNVYPLDSDAASAECPLPQECDKSDVTYYCPVSGVDADLPEPEQVANAYGDANLKDALVECPAGMFYSVLEVTQGVPPLGGYNGLSDFIAAGCDGTTESCVYTPPEGESARIVYQCKCGEGFRPLTNEVGECEYCPVGTHRPFMMPGGDADAEAGSELADSCLACPAGTHGSTESDSSPVPTCTNCPKNTYGDKIGAVGNETCTLCPVGHYTAADSGSTSLDECLECGENFECTVEGERNACPAGFWTDGVTVSISCEPCPTGTYRGDDDDTCMPCVPGTLAQDYGQTMCEACPAGTFAREGGATACEACPVGTYAEGGAKVCSRCDPWSPYTDSFQTTTAEGCWSNDGHSSIDMVISGTVAVKVGQAEALSSTNSNGNSSVRSRLLQAGNNDPDAVVELLESGLLDWLNWASPRWANNSVVDESATRAALGEVDGNYKLSFKVEVFSVPSWQAENILLWSSNNDMLTKMLARMAQYVTNDTDTALTMSPEPVEQSFQSYVVASSDLILYPQLVDYQNPVLADLSCEDLLARFAPATANPMWQIGNGVCNRGAWNTPQCDYDGGDCCSETCTPVSAAYLATRKASSDDCLVDYIGDGYCDYDNNNEACGWDGGDCCSATCEPGPGGDCLEGTFDCRDGTEEPSDIEPRAQSCAPRTMECLAPSAVGSWARRSDSSRCNAAKRSRALLLEAEAASAKSPIVRKAVRRLAPTVEACGMPLDSWGDGVCDWKLNSEECEYDGGDCCSQTCVQNDLYPMSCLYSDCEDPSIAADELTSIYDNEPPVLHNLPPQDADWTVYQCMAPVAPLVTSSDNDPCFEGSLVVPTEEGDVDKCGYTLSRRWSAKDLAGNTATESRTYHVVHTTPPLLTGLPADDTVVVIDGPPGSEVGPDASVAAVDACSGLEVPLTYAEEKGAGNSVSRTWTAGDACGNTVTATRVATVTYSDD